MPAIIFAILTLIGWGIGDIFGAIASRKIGGYSTTLWLLFSAVLMGSFYIPFAIPDLHQYTAPLLILNIVLGLLLIIGNTLINEAMSVSNASLVGVISSAAYSGPAVLLSAFLFKESLNFLQIFGLMIVFMGVIVCSVNFNELRTGHIKDLIKDRGIILALISMMCWSIDAVFIKTLVLKVGWFWPIFISTSLFPLIFFYMRSKKIKVQSPFKKRAFISIILSALFLYGGELTFNLGLKYGAVSIVSSISGAYPALFAILAFIIFRDKITRQQFFGITATLSGILLLTFFR